MAVSLDSSCKKCRRQGMKLFLKGDRCMSEKCAFERRAYAPGQHGQRRRKLSDYALQLREKQRVKQTYGVIEGQFRKYYTMADGMKGITGENLLLLLERRLDNVVYRMGFANSRRQARQLVRHSHFLVNGKKVNIPSYLVSEGDAISVVESSQKKPVLVESLEANEKRVMPEWVVVDKTKMTGTFSRYPGRAELGDQFQEHLVVELYSK
ncbi:MAG: 30S ribosomal protein S4 [Deltaproteobacteria bacterium CG_4_10_14_0_2_um_filter_43_8]|nr:MAG: 30S ribosomal protein S4 [Deltaproteobacteria bacterium CG11_big_fil_rev_8_21_14_0_20_42_23]PJA21582.1 MAG: 30S ribosomal protein S4 [Deltaproteobacteria bacterium CG_4_10_14_0_2_um_filter_43_8]PJC64610.1 MAG: 30S ribosomal protein S4 [Deltaproteobacteria bacterium CG_4_9_14_0_2_um_filter_42_21]